MKLYMTGTRICDDSAVRGMEEHQRSPRSHMGGYRPRKKTAEPNDSPGKNQFIVEKVDYVYYSRADLPEVSSSHDNRCRVS